MSWSIDGHLRSPKVWAEMKEEKEEEEEDKED